MKLDNSLSLTTWLMIVFLLDMLHTHPKLNGMLVGFKEIPERILRITFEIAHLT